MNLKIIQATLDDNSSRQAQSTSQLKSLGERYIKIENTRYDQTPPLDKILGGNKHWYGLPFYGLTPQTYGCWLSHRQSIMLGFCDEGHSLICEGDCKIFDEEKFKARLKEGVDLLDKSDHPILRFEPFYQCPQCPCFTDDGERLPHGSTSYRDQISDHIFECDKIMGAHCYLINEKSKPLFEHLFATVGWSQWDQWLNCVFSKTEPNMNEVKFMEKHSATFVHRGESGRTMLGFPEYYDDPQTIPLGGLLKSTYCAWRGETEGDYVKWKHDNEGLDPICPIRFHGRLTGQFDGFSQISMEHKDGKNGGHLFSEFYDLVDDHV